MAEYAEKSVEYSKVWADNNPKLFTDSLIAFFEQHPHGVWSFSVDVTGGFFTITAKPIQQQE